MTSVQANHLDERSYSLWLLPPPAVGRHYAAMIDTLSQRLGTPRFEPHITLTGRTEASEDVVMAATQELARRLAPVPVRLAGAAHTDAYFRCLYVWAERTPELLFAHRLACELLAQPADKDFMPHVSLVYGNLDAAKEEEVLEAIGGRLPLSFVADRIALYLLAGSPDGWRQVAALALMGDSD